MKTTKEYVPVKHPNDAKFRVIVRDESKGGKAVSFGIYETELKSIQEILETIKNKLEDIK